MIQGTIESSFLMVTNTWALGVSWGSVLAQDAYFDVWRFDCYEISSSLDSCRIFGLYSWMKCRFSPRLCSWSRRRISAWGLVLIVCGSEITCPIWWFSILRFVPSVTFNPRLITLILRNFKACISRWKCATFFLTPEHGCVILTGHQPSSFDFISQSLLVLAICKLVFLTLGFNIFAWRKTHWLPFWGSFLRVRIFVRVFFVSGFLDMTYDLCFVFLLVVLLLTLRVKIFHYFLVVSLHEIILFLNKLKPIFKYLPFSLEVLFNKIEISLKLLFLVWKSLVDLIKPFLHFREEGCQLRFAENVWYIT